MSENLKEVWLLKGDNTGKDYHDTAYVDKETAELWAKKNSGEFHGWATESHTGEVIPNEDGGTICQRVIIDSRVYRLSEQSGTAAIRDDVLERLTERERRAVMHDRIDVKLVMADGLVKLLIDGKPVDEHSDALQLLLNNQDALYLDIDLEYSEC